MKQAYLLLGAASAGAAVASYLTAQKPPADLTQLQEQQKKYAMYFGGLAVLLLGVNWVITRP